MRKSQVDIWRKSIPSRGTSMCKGPQAGPGLACWRYNKEARVAGSEGTKGSVGRGADEESEGLRVPQSKNSRPWEGPGLKVKRLRSPTALQFVGWFVP